jgi:hypothetical protein
MWHVARADVLMTIDLIRFYFQQVVDDSEAVPDTPPFVNNDEDENDDNKDKD